MSDSFGKPPRSLKFFEQGKVMAWFARIDFIRVLSATGEPLSGSHCNDILSFLYEAACDLRPHGAGILKHQPTAALLSHRCAMNVRQDALLPCRDIKPV